MSAHFFRNTHTSVYNTNRKIALKIVDSISLCMEYNDLISAATTAKTNEQYPIWLDGRILIGEAEFLRKDGDSFVFDIQLLGKRSLSNYEFKFSVDAITYELFALRAVKK